LKVCVTSTGPDLNAFVDPRFGRCAYFIIIDVETMKFEALPNPSAHSMTGAGIQAAQFIANKGVDVVITGQVGPNAYQALSAAGVKIITGSFGRVKEVIEKYKNGKLQATSMPMFGLRRMHGRGIYPQIPPSAFQHPVLGSPSTYASPQEEIEALEKYKDKLLEDLKNLEKRIKELKEKRT